MTTFKKSFIIFTKEYFKNILFLICVFALPFTVFFVCYLAVTPGQSAINAGIYFESSSEIDESLSKNLVSNSKYNFILYSERQELFDAVESQDLNVAYVFSEDFSQKVQNGQINNSIKVIRYPNDLYHNFVSEEIFNAVFEIMTPYIAQNYMLDNFDNLNFEEITRSINYYKTQENAFKIELVNLESARSGTAEDFASTLSLANGIICIFLFAVALICNMSQSTLSPLYSNYVGITRAGFYSLAPVFFFSTLSALASLLICSSMLNYHSFNILFEILKLLIYQGLLLISCLTFKKIIGQSIFCVLFPFLISLVLVTHPIFFDIRTIFPSSEIILNFLPSYFYLNFEFNPQILLTFVLLSSFLFALRNKNNIF